VGHIILLASGILFAFTTIVGNSLFGTQCFIFTTKNRVAYLYYGAIMAFIVWGAVSDVKVVWAISDFFILPVAVPHVIGLLILAFKRKDLLTL
jgi:AGCS family alanine or glycine:cation symporter